MISSLIFEVRNKKVKTFIFIFLLLPTIINSFIEIKDKKFNKPEFKKFFNSVKDNDVKNLTVNTNLAINEKASIRMKKLVDNYIKSLEEFQRGNFEKLYQI